MDDITVLYIMEIYNGDNFVCSYETEYPKELKEQLRQSRFLSKDLTYTETYKFFKKIFRNGLCSEWYRIEENAIT